MSLDTMKGTVGPYFDAVKLTNGTPDQGSVDKYHKLLKNVKLKLVTCVSQHVNTILPIILLLDEQTFTSS